MRLLYSDHGVQQAPAGHSHARSGWVQTVCPFCEGNPGYHLGYNLASGYFHCWRCGWKPLKLALATLLGVAEREIPALLPPYHTARAPQDRVGQEIRSGAIPTYMPEPNAPLNALQAAYLRDRRFDPLFLAETWGLRGTDHRAPVGWRHRIVIPITHDGRLVSYTTRSLVDRRDKYKACPIPQETIHHKHLLYGLDQARGMDAVAVVEGPADVWRLGPGAVATFGTQLKPAQRILLRRFRRLLIVFDGDSAGQVAGEKLAWQMAGYGLEVDQVILPPDKDPGSLSVEEASSVMETIKVWHAKNV